jgi:hypothetical protein
MSWGDHPDNDAPEIVARRFGRSREWAIEHTGEHRCVDRRVYRYSCLVSDPTCEAVARSYLEAA